MEETETIQDKQFTIKAFNELSLEELYSVLQLRSSIFVVEQNCAYQDIDGIDQASQHLLVKSKDQICAYLRIVPAQASHFKCCAIGRVVVNEAFRGKGVGRRLMSFTIQYIADKGEDKEIAVSAQHHLQTFYESLGFKVCSSPYDEDGILHVDMKLNFAENLNMNWGCND